MSLERSFVALAVVFLSSFAPTVFGQDWAKAMFDQTTFDFGVVARGAVVEHRFTLENIYEEDVHIQSISSSCGCSTPTVNRRLLKTWEKAEIVVSLDTRQFLGRKDSTITVVFDQPFAAEVQLHIHAYIRSDIVVQPGAVEFGSVVRGAGATKTIAVSYAGRNDWRIVRVECANPHVEAGAVETSRTPGQINYNITVQLKPDAPPGYIHDQLVLVTNDFDARAARVPVAIDGLVAESLSIRPSPLMMGMAIAGQPLTKNIVVQGQSPFRILSAQSTDKRFQCKPTDQSKSAHLTSVTFTASGQEKPGEKISAKIRIETDLSGVNTVELDVTVQIPPAATKTPSAPAAH